MSLRGDVLLRLIAAKHEVEDSSRDSMTKYHDSDLLYELLAATAHMERPSENFLALMDWLGRMIARGELDELIASTV